MEPVLSKKIRIYLKVSKNIKSFYTNTYDCSSSYKKVSSGNSIICMLHKKENIWPKNNKDKAHFNLCIFFCIHYMLTYMFMKFYTCILQINIYVFFFRFFQCVEIVFSLKRNNELCGARSLLCFFELCVPYNSGTHGCVKLSNINTT